VNPPSAQCTQADEVRSTNQEMEVHGVDLQ
jgi:hypothetical protein